MSSNKLHWWLGSNWSVLNVEDFFNNKRRTLDILSCCATIVRYMIGFSDSPCLSSCVIIYASVIYCICCINTSTIYSLIHLSTSSRSNQLSIDMLLNLVLLLTISVPLSECRIEAMATLYFDGTTQSIGTLSFVQQDANSPVVITGTLTSLNATTNQVRSTIAIAMSHSVSHWRASMSMSAVSRKHHQTVPQLSAITIHTVCFPPVPFVDCR